MGDSAPFINLFESVLVIISVRRPSFVVRRDGIVLGSFTLELGCLGSSGSTSGSGALWPSRLVIPDLTSSLTLCSSDVYPLGLNDIALMVELLIPTSAHLIHYLLSNLILVRTLRVLEIFGLSAERRSRPEVVDNVQHAVDGHVLFLNS